MVVSDKRKFLVAVVGAALIVAGQFYADSDVYTAAVALATALGVYQVPNK